VLAKLAKDRPWIKQPQFIRLLRFDLALDNVGVVAQFRRLDWSVNQQAEGHFQHGQDRVGKTIMSQVEGVAELPSEIAVSCPVYQQSGERDEYIVRCLLEIDTLQQSFQLLPLQDELEGVLDAAQNNIRDRLEEGLKEVNGEKILVPIYYGTP